MNEEPTNKQNMIIQNTPKRVILEEDDLSFISMNVNHIMDSLLTRTSNHQPTHIINIATNLDHIEDDRNYTDEINKTLPKLYNKLYPTLNREIIIIKQEPLNLKGCKDWAPFGIERELELERIQSSTFRNQLTVNNVTIGWNKLYNFLQEHWNDIGIPYKNRNELMIVESEFASFPLCNVLPKNYKEQGFWVYDPSKGRFYNFFSNLNVHETQRKWLNNILFDCCL